VFSRFSKKNKDLLSKKPKKTNWANSSSFPSPPIINAEFEKPEIDNISEDSIELSSRKERPGEVKLT
jgi:hypothetical protein